MNEMKNVIICDLDGTLANCDHRRHLVEKFHPDGTKNRHRDYEAFYLACGEDSVHEAVHKLLVNMCGWNMNYEYRQYEVVFVTGRPERTRALTERWLESNTDCPAFGYGLQLYMRPDGDTRPDYVVKQEILDTKLDKDRILLCLDDRQQVVDMWRTNGLVCMQVAKGDF
jgi:hypothetical protein